MKQKIITLSNGEPERIFHLFPSVAAIHEWLNSLKQGKPTKVDGLQEIVLGHQETIELESLGFEYVYVGDTFKRFEHVRLIKTHKTQNAAGLEAQVYEGWLINN